MCSNFQQFAIAHSADSKLKRFRTMATIRWPTTLILTTTTLAAIGAAVTLYTPLGESLRENLPSNVKENLETVKENVGEWVEKAKSSASSAVSASTGSTVVAKVNKSGPKYNVDMVKAGKWVAVVVVVSAGLGVGLFGFGGWEKIKLWWRRRGDRKQP